MFLPDPKTLSLLIGIANLLFALLATIYLANSRTRNPALEIWRWGRLMSGCGYLLNLVSTAAPHWVHPVTGHLLQLGGGGCDVVAYALLLGYGHWGRRTAWAIGLAMGSLVLVSLLMQGQHLRLLLFSLYAVMVYSVLVWLVLNNSAKDGLRHLIGLVDTVLLVVLVVRVGKGLMVGPLVRFDNDLLTLVLYFTVYLVIVINGFGFLLLAKQQSDRTLHTALDQLSRADQDRRKLLAMASHEFRTPVAKIKAALDSLRFLPDSQTPQIAGRLANIRLASERLTDLANTLLTYERLQHPDLQAQREPVDLVALCQSVAAQYPVSSGLVVDVPSGPVMATVDPVQIRIALQNLVDNALEHSGKAFAEDQGGPDAGAGLATVRLYLVCHTCGIEIGVADAGLGIPPEDQPVIFEPFHNPRGDLLRGVGLSIVQQIARGHGGEAFVRDNVPQGTVIGLMLPA